MTPANIITIMSSKEGIVSRLIVFLSDALPVFKVQDFENFQLKSKVFLLG